MDFRRPTRETSPTTSGRGEREKNAEKTNRCPRPGPEAVDGDVIKMSRGLTRRGRTSVCFCARGRPGDSLARSSSNPFDGALSFRNRPVRRVHFLDAEINGLAGKTVPTENKSRKHCLLKAPLSADPGQLGNKFVPVRPSRFSKNACLITFFCGKLIFFNTKKQYFTSNSFGNVIFGIYPPNQRPRLFL